MRFIVASYRLNLLELFNKRSLDSATYESKHWFVLSGNGTVSGKTLAADSARH